MKVNLNTLDYDELDDLSKPVKFKKKIKDRVPRSKDKGMNRVNKRVIDSILNK